jgi:hypothetical protein
LPSWHLIWTKKGTIHASAGLGRKAQSSKYGYARQGLAPFPRSPHEP